MAKHYKKNDYQNKMAENDKEILELQYFRNRNSTHEGNQIRNEKKRKKRRKEEENLEIFMDVACDLFRAEKKL